MSKLVAALIVAALAASPAVASSGKSKSSKKDKIICQSIQETGSRMGNLRACMTRDQWREWEREHEWQKASGEVMLRDAPLPTPNTINPPQ